MQAESRFIFESMKYKIVMAVGAFAVMLNASLFVLNVFHGADINKLLFNSLSALAVCLAMWSYHVCSKSAKRCNELLTIRNNSHETKFDYGNNVGRYHIYEFSDKFIIYKESKLGYDEFIVRSFPFSLNDDTSRKKARLRAYSLLNHITDNGKLWRAESK